MQRRVADAAIAVGLAAAYVVAARASLAVNVLAGSASLFWPAAGIAVAALVLLGPQFWPGIFLGAFVTSLLNGAPIPVALAIATGNTCEPVLAAYLLRRVNFNPTLESVRSVVWLFLLGAVVSTLASATIAAAALYFGRNIPPVRLASVWSAWWIGHMVAVLLVTPVILVWAKKPRMAGTRSLGEAAALGATIILAELVTFFGTVPLVSQRIGAFYQSISLLLVLLWAALRFGQRGAATAAFGISKMAVIATALGYGPFFQPRMSTGMMSLQTFMAFIAVTFLLLGASAVETQLALEQARRAEEEASRANRAKSEFLAVMSHELRTPLNAIGGFAQLLQTNVHGELNPRQAEDVQRIIRNEKQLLGIIDSVLGFVSVEQGNARVAAEDVQVAKVFDAVEPLIQPELGQKHLVFRRDLARPHLAVHADPRGLQEILVSLLSNASKYNKDGGTITLGAEPQGNSVRIWVSDTGVGISHEELERVFEPFIQGDRGTTRRYSGIGLGLSIARALARRMEGELTISSKEGSGTTASVALPAA